MMRSLTTFRHLRILILIPGIILILSSIAAAQIQHTWVPVGGPEGGEMSALARSNAAVIAGTKRGAIYRSADRGLTWNRIRSDFSDALSPVGRIDDLAAAGDTVYAATNGGVFRSLDNGSTWSRFQAFNSESRIAISGGTILVADPDGNIRDLAPDEPFPAGSHVPCLSGGLLAIARGPHAMVASTTSGFYSSTNRGADWTEVTLDTVLRNYAGYAAIVFGDTIIGGTVEGKGLLRSVDNGEHWDAAPLPLNTYFYHLERSNGILYATTNNAGILRSLDGGATWAPLGAGAASGSFNSLVVGADFMVGAVGSAGVARSSDMGTSWTLANAGIISQPIWDLFPSNTTLIAGTSFGADRLSDGETAWQQLEVPKGEANPVGAVITIGNDMFMGNGRGAFRSSDNGDNWTQINSGFTKEPVTAFGAMGDTLFVATYGGVYRSFNHGSSWQPANSGMERIGVDAFATIGTTMLTCYGNYLMRSTDLGDSWEKIAPLLSDEYFTSVMTIGSRFYVTTRSGVFRSADYGATWTRFGADVLQGNNLLAGIGGDIYAEGGNAAILRTSDDGKTWTPVGDGVGELGVMSIAAHNGALYAGTIRDGVFKLEYTALDVPGTADRDGLQLAEAVPNPATTWADISYTASSGGPVHITLFDAMGREVLMLADGTVSAGEHTIRIDAAGLAPGAYYCRLEAAGLMRTRMLVIAR